MKQHAYTDRLITQNITYGLLGSSILMNRKSLRDFSNHTVIIMTDEITDEVLIRMTAERVLSGGCKNIVFYGPASEEWQSIFDDTDREINGFNDMTGYDDFAVMWRFEDMDMLPDEVSVCWNEVLILCSNKALIRQCRELLDDLI